VKLDRTRIAIVERNQPELLDLSFLVLGEFFVPTTGLVLILAVPLAIMNYFLIEWMAAGFIEDLRIWRYLWTISLLVYVQAPFASVLATAYLAKVTFYEQPTFGALIRDVLSLGHRIVWTQLILRGVLLLIWMVLMVERDDSFSLAEGFLPCVCFGIFVWRSLRPYINEIVLLERSPIRAKSDQITIGKRSNRLHGPNAGELFGRGIVMVPVTFTLGLAILGLLWFIVATFTNDWGWGPVMVHVAAPATLWCLAIYMTVFRFLSYLDLRIRREGWEVELMMRAEATRMNERMDFGHG